MDQRVRPAGGTLVFARTEWRARGRSHLLLAVLTGLAVGVTLATFCAADRSRMAFDRLRVATYASDIVLPIATGDPSTALEAIRQTSGVIDARAMSALFVRPDASELFPTSTLMAIAPRAVDGVSLVDTPVITDGRAPRPDHAEEVALSAGLAGDLRLDPGDRLSLESMTDDWVDLAFAGADPGSPDGPSVTVTVTGIARSPAEFGQFRSIIHLTPAFVDRYERRIARQDAIHADLDQVALGRLRDGEIALPIESNDAPSPFDDLGSTQNGLGTIAVALRLVGVVGAAVGSLAVALALTRAARVSTHDRIMLRALGWTRSDELRALLVAFAPPLVAGLLGGGVIGVVASRPAMVGLARAIDPQPHELIVSLRLLLLVLAGAAVVAVTILLAVALLEMRRSPRRSTRFVSIRIWQPLTLHLGLRDALVAPVDRGGRVNRGAILAVAFATAVALGSLVVSTSIARLQEDPSLTGERPERVIDVGPSAAAFDEVMARLAADDRVKVLGGQHVAFGTLVGLGEIPLLMFEPPRRGEPQASVTTGRMPSTPDELALGPEIVELTGFDIGDEVELSAEAGTRSYEVVGTVLFPEGDFDFTHDEGVAVTAAGGAAVVGDFDEARSNTFHQVVFEWRDGVDAAAADRELTEEGFVVLSPGDGRRTTPGNVTNLGRVEHLPRQLAWIVGLLAAISLVHAAWSGVALRARELMTLRALGMTRRASAALSSIATFGVMGAGVLAGVPLGAAIGRQVWRLVAEDAHVVVRPVIPVTGLGALLGAALVIALAVGALAARWTTRLRPEVILRAE